MIKINIDETINSITRLRKEAYTYTIDNPGSLMKKIECLTRCLVFIGRLSAFLDGEYERAYAYRKLEYAKAIASGEQTVQKNEALAEIKVATLRQDEATMYEQKMRWRNAFIATTEEIHTLKLQMKIDFRLEEGANVHVQSNSEAKSQAR